ncbi:cytochrome c biogenesis heme-transporting ATPase CcmA [Solemya velum gill symbiont]|uniref:cytochrome c biogenesis heme-transporting ATPase CcmA n=1 Tax=Solemya velum gill symbiont TaxID=2340 RepID=UPI0021183784|nr:cytochrome c biogenesis heme-transporting ATPase CcmA [Solemya velum gill symbiont]
MITLDSILETETTSSSKLLLEADSLACIRDDRLLFENLSFGIHSGEAVVLEGRNGTGKTTLLRILCGLRRPDEGEVRWNGESIERCTTEYHRYMAFVGHTDGVKRELTPLENLRVLQTLCGKGNLSIEQALEAVKLYGFEDVPVHYLSAGQKRRAGLARLLVTDVRIWVLDEPFTSLDREGIKLTESLMDLHLSNGGALVMTSHHEVNLLAPNTQVINLSA